jgi:hypothetical protein
MTQISSRRIAASAAAGWRVAHLQQFEKKNATKIAGLAKMGSFA